MKLAKFLCIAGISVSFLSSPVYALSTHDQSKFKQAEKYLEIKDLHQYYKLKSQLKNDPLYPYLLYREITQDFSGFDSATVEKVLKTYKGTYWAKVLTSAWLDYLGETKQWKKYAKVYQRGNSITQRCWYWHAKYETGFKSLALKGFTNVWLASGSLPESCSTMIGEWEGSKEDTYAVRWKRVVLAMSIGGTTLAKSLVKSLPKSDQKFVLAWIEARHYPQRDLLVFYSQEKKSDHFDLAFQDIMNAYIQKDLDSAIAFWQKFKGRKAFSESLRSEINGQIGIHLARRYDLTAMGWFKKTDDQYKSDLAWQWQARLAIRFSQWKTLLMAMQKMPVGLKKNPEWQYWLGRAYAENKETLKKFL